MVEPRPEISMRRQAELLRVNRSGLYYESAPADEEELSVMRRLDELHLVHPFYGSRKLALELRSEGVLINRKRVQRLMRLMGIVAMVPKPNTSKPAPENKTYPYLLRNLAILWPNQVWAADITYIPMARGFGYLVAIIDWFSRRVLAWRLSNSLDTRFCVDALEEALERFGQPDIFNTDQGSQFTADDFTRPLLDRGVKVSMDGKGRCIVTVRLATSPSAASDHGDCQAGDGGLADWPGGRQRCGRSSSRRFCGWEPILPSTSVR
jgi:putative transposase